MRRAAHVLMIVQLAVAGLALGTMVAPGFAVAQTPDDLDGDGVLNSLDNCPFDANANQLDADGDGLGNACDPRDDRDLDGDGDLNSSDNCPFAANANQLDSDGDGLGDVCDPRDDRDLDGDGVINASDNCPFTSNSDQADEDGDGAGNVCDPFSEMDLDSDGFPNHSDNCPFVSNVNQADTDGDGFGDECDSHVNAINEIPHEGAWLAGAAPNPSADRFKIRFVLPRDTRGTLGIFDLAGRRLRTLETGMLRAGEHATEWDGRTESGEVVPSGMYFCRLRADDGGFDQRLVKTR